MNNNNNKTKFSCSFTFLQFCTSIFTVWYIHWLSADCKFSVLKTWAIYELTCLGLIGMLCFIIAAILAAINEYNSKNNNVIDIDDENIPDSRK